MDVVINYEYKLCDFKPAYGLIFSELIAGYDFWGMGDIDVIYGNIRDFMTDEILSMDAPVKLTMSGRSKLTTYFAGEDCKFRYVSGK